MAFKVGQKVVCIHNGKWKGYFDGPEKDEILTIDFLVTDSDPRIGLGFNKYSTRMGFASRCFRPLDYDFVSEVEKMAQKEVKKQELTILN